MEDYSAITKNGVLPFVTTVMDLEVIMLSKISQIPYNFIHMWHLRNITEENKPKK